MWLLMVGNALPNVSTVENGLPSALSSVNEILLGPTVENALPSQAPTVANGLLLVDGPTVENALPLNVPTIENVEMPYLQLIQLSRMPNLLLVVLLKS